MLLRILSAVALMALAGCAATAPAGGLSSGTAAAERAPPPPAAAGAGAAPVAADQAQGASAAAPQSANGDVVVPGSRERQVPAPGGDPRSNAERMQDIRAWDRCVMNVQAAGEADPMRPQLTTPEDYCSQSLGMANRTAVPQSRLERRR